MLGLKYFQDIGFNKIYLLSVSYKICAGSEIQVNILRALIASFIGTSPNKEVISCNGIIYVSNLVTGFFL